MTSAASQRKSSTAVQWYTHNATNESAVLDMANSRQIALRSRLRNTFWLTDCKPMGTVTVNLAVRKLEMIDPRDSMTPEEVAEVLSNHYGFKQTEQGFIIPDLIEDRDFALSSANSRQVRAAQGGRGKAAAALAGQELQGVPIQAPDKPPIPEPKSDHDF